MTDTIGVISCWVEGQPVTEGSTKTVTDRAGKPHIIHVKQRELDTWRSQVRKAAWTAARKAGWPIPLDEPVGVTALFYLQRPRTITRERPWVRPDLDKLARSIGDALQDKQGAVITEDSRIITWHLQKFYAATTKRPGVNLTITRLGVPF